MSSPHTLNSYYIHISLHCTLFQEYLLIVYNMEGVLSIPLRLEQLSELEYNAKDYLLSHGLSCFLYMYCIMQVKECGFENSSC